MSRSGSSKPAGSSASTSASLSNVVSSLVRAQHGLTAREGLESETDLDRHVADLLLKDAKAREERAAREKASYWRLSDDEGEQQYQSKTNKRFLKSMLRNLEDHNKPLIRPESRKEQLDAIRARDRAEREARRAGKEAAGASQAEAQRSSSRSGSADVARVSSSRDASEPVRATEGSSSRSRVAPSGFAAKALAQSIGGQARGSGLRSNGSSSRAAEAAVPTSDYRHDKGRSRSRDRSRSGDNHYTDKGKGKERAADREEVAEPSRSRSKRYRGDSADLREESPPRTSRRDDKARSTSDRHSRTSREIAPQDRPTSEDREGRDDFRGRRWSRSPPRSTSEVGGSARHRRGRDGDRKRDTRDVNKHVQSQHSPIPPSDDHSKRRERRRRRSPSTAQSDYGSSDTFIDTTEGAAIANGGGSKMDKYFSSMYDPALDVSVTDLTDPRTGLIAEGNFEGWDAMLSVLKQRKEDKVSGVSKAQEEERERQIRKLERRHRREERELRRAERREKKRRKKRRRGSDSESRSDSDTSSSSRGQHRHSSGRSRSKPKVVGTVNIDGFEYVRQGGERAWDMGKDKML